MIPLSRRLSVAQVVAPLFQNLDYRRLLFSNGLWWQLMFMEFIVIGWLVLDMTDSTWMVALIGFFRSFPFLITGFVGGIITDRLGRRTVILLSQTTSLLLYTLLTLLLWWDALALWHLAIIAFGLGITWSMDFPSRRALIPDFVGKEKTTDALLLENFIQSISRIIGPFFSGWLINSFGALGCFFAMAIIAGISLSILCTLSNRPIPRPAPLAQNAQTSVTQITLIKQGLQYVAKNQTILAVMLITVAVNLWIISYISLLPTFARDVLQQDSVGLGFLDTATGLGSFVGLFLIIFIRRHVRNGWIFIAGTCLWCIALVFFAASTIYPLSWFMLFVAGIGRTSFVILQSSILLVSASDDMRSRVMGTLILAIGADPLGKLQTGFLAETFGAPLTLGLQAGLAALFIILIAIWLPGLRRDRTV